MNTEAPSVTTTYASQGEATPDPTLWNADLAPVKEADKTWNSLAFASLWVAMVACVPTYLLAGGLVAAGMNWWQAVLTVFLGNAIVLIPMIAIGHMGAKYGVPFPVLLRSSFGPKGAKIPAVARGLVACGWFGINTWLGGSAIYIIVNSLFGDILTGSDIPLLGINAGEVSCFLGFWLLHLYFIRKGTDSIKWLEMLAAPFLLLMLLALLAWAYMEAGGFGAMLSAPSHFVEGGPKEGQFWSTFIISLTGMVGFWATMALNIPDFTRFAKDQRSQMIGQALGLPLPMALFAFVSVAVTSASVVIYGEAIWNPVDLAGRMGGVGVVVALAALTIATLSTNLAANVVAPAYGFSSLKPSKISFVHGGYITAVIGILIFPWRLVEDADAYIFTWLVGYSALLGPIAGILVADYFFLRKQNLVVADLFSSTGQYAGTKGWNFAGLIALVIGVIPNVPGFLHTAGFVDQVPQFLQTLYTYSWFVGFALAAVVYSLLSLGKNQTN